MPPEEWIADFSNHINGRAYCSEKRNSTSIGGRRQTIIAAGAHHGGAKPDFQKVRVLRYWRWIAFPLARKILFLFPTQVLLVQRYALSYFRELSISLKRDDSRGEKGLGAEAKNGRE